MTSGALVLAGGGVAGIAWEIGVLAGIRDVEPAVFDRIMDPATTFVGTSAGSTVASQLASGVDLDQLYASQLAEESAELGAEADLAEFSAMMAAAAEGATSPEEVRRRIGRIALDAKTASAADRRAVIAARLPVDGWSDRRLLITAVDTGTGELRVFDRDSGVDLIDAIGASCAVPSIWPTVEIQGRQYMDGGMRSAANADLAAGCDPVLIVVPSPENSPYGPPIPKAELDALAPARIHTIFADDAAVAAFGPNPLDPAVRPASARAGRALGRAIAREIAAFWA
jgi:NTE family protein